MKSPSASAAPPPEPGAKCADQQPDIAFSPLSDSSGIIGVVVDSVTPSNALQLVTALRSLIESHGVLLLRNAKLHEWSASAMCDFMVACFGEGGLSSYATLPRDPARDGDDSAPGANVPGEVRCRMLGNGMEQSTGKPKCLMAKMGYEWHQVSGNFFFFCKTP